jgi:hypothetical protein
MLADLGLELVQEASAPAAGQGALAQKRKGL